ncbi:hypothetical protein [Bacillus sp. T33-2]|uniref:hypothetical protein n=1 Tax=Bacillus sp. T33-2 TaxID=2054168 RepID=UPI000C77A29D|nr:hypothetical protein [Bacillus sp. T33-2]PLR94840.1 hypothetical protein CVD19_16335 [Bacillus sp. T33-2]
MNYELGVSGPFMKFTMKEINEKAKARMNRQSNNVLETKYGSTEYNYLEGLVDSSERASGPVSNRQTKSFLDGLDVMDKKLERNRQEEEKHRQEMRRLLGDDYKSPSETYEELKENTEWLKGL